MPSDQGAVPVPYALCTLLCDQVYKDRATGKSTFLGAFSTIGSQEFPATHPEMVLHVELTDGRGKTHLELKLIDAEEQRSAVAVVPGEVEFPDPRSIAEIDFQMRNIVFPAPGEYRFQVWANGEFLIERRLLVVHMGKREGDA